MTTLSETIADYRQQSAARIPQNVKDVMANAIRTVVDSGLAASAMQKGGKAPPFSLPNADGETVSSGDLLAKGPLVVSFYRGGWCPYCNFELRALQDALPEIEALGARLIAISPELPDKALDTKRKDAISFEVLSDVGNRVADQFGIIMTVPEALRPIYLKFGIDIPAHNGDGDYRIPLPATYVIGSDGIIGHAFVDADYTRRLEPEAVVDALKKMAG